MGSSFGRGSNSKSSAQTANSFQKDRIFVISVHFNPANFAVRNQHAKEHMDYLAKFGEKITPVLIECAYEGEPFRVTQPRNPFHFRVTAKTQLWIKENLLNVAINRLPKALPDENHYIVWMDLDIVFLRDDWPDLVTKALQTYEVIQIFDYALNVGPSNMVDIVYKGFGVFQANNLPIASSNFNPAKYAHPGYGWAARRETIELFGGLFERAIVGSGDKLMAYAFIGRPEEAWPFNISISEEMKKCYYNWASNAFQIVKGSVGYIQATIKHKFHGEKVNRRYWERWKMLMKYDPMSDVEYNKEGVLELKVSDTKDFPHRLEMATNIRKYFHSRNEDC